MFNYGDSIPEELILGYIGWYSVSDVDVTSARLTELAIANKLDVAHLPSAPRPADAFKRACRYSERRGVPVPATSLRANFLIRKVANAAASIEQHMVMEIVDAEDRQLAYTVVANLIWDRGNNRLIIRKAELGEDYNELILDSLQRFQNEFKRASTTIDPQVIRLMVRSMLENMGAISVRNRGSIYFVPNSQKEQMFGLEGLISGLGGNSGFHTLPLIDNEKQREMVQNAFQEEIHDEASRIIGELKDYRADGKAISPAAWSKYKEAFNRIKESKTQYENMLEIELSIADMEVQTLAKAIAGMIEDDLVK